jgi:hypothetical protein
MTETHMLVNPDLQLTVRERHTRDSLRIDCTFTNRADGPLYVFTCMASAWLEPLPHRAYTAFREEDRALHVLLGVPPIPKDLDVHVKIVPFSSLVQPGKSVSEYFEMPIPVPEWQPYADPEEAVEAETVSAAKIVVTAEYFGTTRLLREPRWDVSIGLYKAHGVPVLRTQGMIELAEPIPILKRKDDFTRF